LPSFSSSLLQPSSSSTYGMVHHAGGATYPHPSLAGPLSMSTASASVVATPLIKTSDSPPTSIYGGGSSPEPYQPQQQDPLSLSTADSVVRRIYN
jgi:hypothetical protein